MSNMQLVIVFAALAGAAAFLFIWRRRDKGLAPEDVVPIVRTPDPAGWIPLFAVLSEPSG